jgi:hypothetical protein
LSYEALLATIDDLSRLIRTEEAREPADLLALQRLRFQQRDLMREAVKRRRKEGNGVRSPESQGEGF